MLQSETKKKDQKRKILGSCHRAEKAVERKGDCDTNSSRSPWNSAQRPAEVTWETGDQGRPRRQQFSDQQEYWEKSCKSEETCNHPDSSEKLIVKTGMKNLQGVE